MVSDAVNVEIELFDLTGNRIYYLRISEAEIIIDVRYLAHNSTNNNVFAMNLAILDCEVAIPVISFQLSLNKVGQQTVFVATTMALFAQ